MHHPRADGARRLCHRAGARALHRVEGLRTALGQNADQVDGGVGAAHRGLDGRWVAQIGLHGMDLADLAERLQMACELRPTHRDPDTVVALAERADHVSPHKARSPENRDQSVQIRCHGLRFPGVKFERPRAYLAVPRYAIMSALYSIFGSRRANLTSARPIRSNRPQPRWWNW